MIASRPGSIGTGASKFNCPPYTYCVLYILCALCVFYLARNRACAGTVSVCSRSVNYKQQLTEFTHDDMSQQFVSDFKVASSSICMSALNAERQMDCYRAVSEIDPRLHGKNHDLLM